MQKETILFQTYVLTWILLLFSTIAVQAGVGGVYFISAWNAVVFLGCVVASLEGMLSSEIMREREGYRSVRFLSEDEEEEEENREADRSPPVEHAGDPEQAHSSTAAEPAHEEPAMVEETTEATERTPLIQRHVLERRPSLKTERGGAVGWWILQLLLVVPVPVVLVSHLSFLMIGAMSQTVGDTGQTLIGRLFCVQSYLVLTWN